MEGLIINANEGTTVQVSFLDITGKAVTPKVAILGENRSSHPQDGAGKHTRRVLPIG